MGQMILDVQAFLETGGDVLLVIGGVTVVMWTLMLERFYFFYRIFPSAADTVRNSAPLRPSNAAIGSAASTTSGAPATNSLSPASTIALIRIFTHECHTGGALRPKPMPLSRAHDS